jgi:phenylalanyl-tRNA synthetase beta subunit
MNSSVLVIADSTNQYYCWRNGGMDTEVESKTKRIVLECANFDRFNIKGL